MKIVMLNGQNHKGSTYHIGRQIIDMMFDYWMVHRPKACMFEKRAVIVSTSAGSSPKSAMKDVEDAFFYMGIPSITKYGIAVQAMNWDGVKESKKKEIDKATTNIARKLSRNRKPHVGIKTKFMFNMMRMMQKNDWGASPVEKAYWEQNGWLSSKRPWK